MSHLKHNPSVNLLKVEIRPIGNLSSFLSITLEIAIEFVPCLTMKLSSQFLHHHLQDHLY